MGVYIADNQGAIDKSIGALMVSDGQGAIDKEINKGFVADGQGSIDKKFYENWVYYTGTILNSSSGGGQLYPTASLTPDALSYYIKPYRIQTSAYVCTTDVSTTSSVRLEARYLDASNNWVTLKSTTRTVTDSSQLIALDFYVTEDIMTKGLQYRLVRVGSELVDFWNFSGKCTAWYKKG